MEWKYLFEEVVIGFQVGQPDNYSPEDRLNELGGGGWEAVAAFPAPTPDDNVHVLVLFKQPTESK